MKFGQFNLCTCIWCDYTLIVIHFFSHQAREIMHIVATMAASIKSGDMKNVGAAYGCSSPHSAESPDLKNTANVVGSLLAQLNPVQESLGKLKAGIDSLLD